MNLLPDTEKEALKRGLRLRFFIVASFMIAIALVVSLGALAPAYILARVRLVEIVSKANIALQNNGDTTSDVLLKLPSEITAKLKVMEVSIPKYSTAEIFYEIANAVPDGVTIDSITFSGIDKKGKKLDVGGTASTRKSLIDFSETLRQVTFVSEVDVPVSNLTRDRNLPYSIKITIKE